MGNLTWDEVAQTETDKRYIDMYGCSLAELIDMWDDSRREYMGGPYMLAMSILSDAQECIAIGMDDRARQYINRAKYVMRAWNTLNDNNSKSDSGLTNQTI